MRWTLAAMPTVLVLLVVGCGTPERVFDGERAAVLPETPTAHEFGYEMGAAAWWLDGQTHGVASWEVETS